MDMEVDDFQDLDQIGYFLSTKFDEVKHSKENMKATVRVLQGFIDKFQKEQSDSSKDLLEVGDVWKRIFNGKYVFGIEVRNISDGDITEINCTLQWKSIMSSIYKVQIYSLQQKAFIEVLRKDQIATVLLVINQIYFSRDLDYDANCKIFYLHSENQHQKSIQKISCSVNDFGTTTEVKGLDLEVGGKYAVMAAMAAQNQIALVARLLENHSRNLENYLVIDCMLRVTEFDGMTFVFERISEAVDKSILKFFEKEGVYYMDIFYRDKVSLQHILHHLHKHVKHLYILPRRFEMELRKLNVENNFGTQMYVSQILKDAGDSGDDFRKGLLEQIGIVNDFHVNVVECSGVSDSTDVSDEFGMIRNLLSQKELKCDIAFEQIKI